MTTYAGNSRAAKTVRRIVSRNPDQRVSMLTTLSNGASVRHPANASGRFLVASVTKTLFAAITLRLAARGLIGIDQPAALYVPSRLIEGLVNVNGIDFSNRVTVGDLLSHQSGIPDYYPRKKLTYNKALPTVSAADPGWTREQAIGIAKSMTAEFEPHSGRTSYSFTNYQVLGAVLENVSGRGLSALLREELTGPLGMSDTILLTPANHELFDYFQPVLYGRYAYRGSRRIASLGAEGAVVSSLDDLTKFARAISFGGFLNEGSLSNMMTMRGNLTRGVEYGLGLMRIKFPGFLSPFRKLPHVYGHLGATGSFMLWTEGGESTIVGTTNQFRGLPQRIAIIRAALLDTQMH